jgi:hypothetical protein
LRNLLSLLPLLLTACTSWATIGQPPDDPTAQISSDWDRAAAVPDTRWSFTHAQGATVTLRDAAPPCSPTTCAVWALATLDSQWPGAQLVSREEPDEDDPAPRWRITVVGQDQRRRELTLWHTPARVYVLDAQGSASAMMAAAPDLDRIIASFTPAPADQIVTRAHHKGPDTSSLAARGISFATDIVPATSRAGLIFTPIDPARVQILHSAALIQGEVRSHTLPYPTPVEEYLRALQRTVLPRFDGPVELVIESDTAGTLFVRESAMGSLVPMIHVWRVQLHGISAVQVALSTPAELYDANKPTLVALLRAFQPRR